MRILVFAFGWLLATVAASKLAAQEVHDYQAGLADAVTVAMDFNTEFEISKSRPLPHHFSVSVPMNPDDVTTRTRVPESGNLGEMMFLTTDGVFLEYVTLSTGTVPSGPLEARMQALFSVIEGQVYPSLGLAADAQILGGRRAEIAGHPAVEYLALADDPNNGPLAARIVGVLAPNETDVLFFVQQTMRDRMGLGSPDDLAATYAGSILASLEFRAYRDAAGALVAY